MNTPSLLILKGTHLIFHSQITVVLLTATLMLVHFSYIQCKNMNAAIAV